MLLLSLAALGRRVARLPAWRRHALEETPLEKAERVIGDALLNAWAEMGGYEAFGIVVGASLVHAYLAPLRQVDRLRDRLWTGYTLARWWIRRARRFHL